MGQLVLESSLAQARITRAQDLMRHRGIDFMLLPVSAELEWLTGYQAHALERLTVLILGQTNVPKLVVPELEVVTLQVPPELFSVHKWSQGSDPFQMAARFATGLDELNFYDARTPYYIAVGKNMPAQHLLPFQNIFKEHAIWMDTSTIISQLRRTKDAGEVAALMEVGRVVDLTIAEIQNGAFPLLGRTEREVAEQIKASMLRNDHDSVSFCIVATGPNSADPHHEPDDTIIESGHIVLFDIGGRRNGYSSDITRCVSIGQPSLEMWENYCELIEAQERAFLAAQPGVRACDVHEAARGFLQTSGLDLYFIHSTGHGIGLDAHEDPFITTKNQEPLLVGDAFSIEPGVYFMGRYGFRLEDCVIMTENGATRLTHSPRELIVLER